MPLLPSPARHNSWGPPRNGHRHAALTQSLAVDSKDAASAIGYVIGAGSVLLYTPMIFRVARRKCAAGLSPSTWLLKLGCYFVTDIYNLSNGYPLSSFAETITLFFQALVMLLLVCYFERLSVCIRFLYARIHTDSRSRINSTSDYDSLLSSGRSRWALRARPSLA